MENKTNDNWVDLSTLPKFNVNINWKQSVGCVVKFRYRGINGEAVILDVDIKKRKLRVYIANWTPADGRSIQIQDLQMCELHKLYNTIGNFAPETVVYFVNRDDAYRHSPYSRNKVMMLCPHCGTQKEYSPAELLCRGFVCYACGDGVSYPNKLMFHALTQLNIKFKREISKKYKEFRWCQDYRYDFYFELENRKYIIEMDGGFHDIETQKLTDDIKTQLAIDNGIELIRIDCKYQHEPFDYIVNNIKNSILSDILCINKVDWLLCDEYARNSLMHKACTLWEKYSKSMGEIMEICQLSKTTVRQYLIRGRELGLCPSYNKNETRHRARFVASRPVGCCVDGEIKYVFLNARDIERLSIKIGAPKFFYRSIQKVCLGHLSSYRGVVFKYVDFDFYESFQNTKNQEFNIEEFLLQEHDVDPIAVIENAKVICVFNNADECSRLSYDIFGVHYNLGNIYSVLSGRHSMCMGREFKRITIEEYEQYKMIEKNKNIEVVFEKEMK